MKGVKGLVWLNLVLTVLLALSLPVYAAEDGYTYTVRFFAGQQGTFSGSDVITFEGLHYGDRVTFNQSIVTLQDDSKYYVKGIRESGKDNNTAGMTSFVVTGDADYVVAYGILGSAVAYTVYYQDADGNDLAPAETYYGNVGDMPVIAYLYIEGYQPQAYNLTKTLAEDASENVFTFVYAPIQTAAAPTVTPPPGLAAGGGTDEGPEGADNSEVGADFQDEEPRELINLDDPDTPLANVTLDDESGKNIGADAFLLAAKRLVPWCIGVVVLGLALVLILTKQKKKEPNRDEPQ
jgi:hypothetical protein